MNLANVSLYGFEDYHGVDIGVVRAVRLWFAPLGGEVPVEIKINEGDLKLGFAIGRTQEVSPLVPYKYFIVISCKRCFQNLMFEGHMLLTAPVLFVSLQRRHPLTLML